MLQPTTPRTSSNDSRASQTAESITKLKVYRWALLRSMMPRMATSPPVVTFLPPLARSMPRFSEARRPQVALGRSRAAAGMPLNRTAAPICARWVARARTHTVSMSTERVRFASNALMRTLIVEELAGGGGGVALAGRREGNMLRVGEAERVGKIVDDADGAGGEGRGVLAAAVPLPLFGRSHMTPTTAMPRMLPMGICTCSSDQAC